MDDIRQTVTFKGIYDLLIKSDQLIMDLVGYAEGHDLQPFEHVEGITNTLTKIGLALEFLEKDLGCGK